MLTKRRRSASIATSVSEAMSETSVGSLNAGVARAQHWQGKRGDTCSAAKSLPRAALYIFSGLDCEDPMLDSGLAAQNERAMTIDKPQQIQKYKNNREGGR